MSRQGKSQAIAYRCKKCGTQNYVLERHEKAAKMELVKFCSTCRQKTAHKESRKLK